MSKEEEKVPRRVRIVGDMGNGYNWWVDGCEKQRERRKILGLPSILSVELKEILGLKEDDRKNDD